MYKLLPYVDSKQFVLVDGDVEKRPVATQHHLQTYTSFKAVKCSEAAIHLGTSYT